MAEAPKHGITKLAGYYQRFARLEASGQSAIYESLASAIASDDSILEKIAELPPRKRQPNLLFGVVNLLYGREKSAAERLELIQENWSVIRNQVENRNTQTNEPARTAILLPVLAQMRQPIALLELGAAAGLCLVPDMYDFSYMQRDKSPNCKYRPRFNCELLNDVPIPDEYPDIIWRRGIDLEPIDLRDEDSRRWLEALVWPEHGERLNNLRLAIDAVKTSPPELIAADFLSETSRLFEGAPKGASQIVMHSAALAYVEKEDRQRFAERMRRSPYHWLSFEGAGVMPFEPDVRDPPIRRGAFELRLNGQLVAQASPHGQWIEWVRDREIVNEILDAKR